jgi:hypothetical protein
MKTGPGETPVHPLFILPWMSDYNDIFRIYFLAMLFTLSIQH